MLFACLTDKSEFFEVNVNPGDRISAIREAIHAKIKVYRGHDIPLNALTLYKAEISMDPEGDRLVRARTYIDKHRGKALDPAMKVHNVFNLPLNADLLHILVEVSDNQEGTLIDIYYFACTRKVIPPKCSQIVMGVDRLVSDLETAIGSATSGVGYVSLWKPNSFLSKNGREDLVQRLHEAAEDFRGFCDSLEEKGRLTIGQLFAGKVSQRGASRTTLIAELLGPSLDPVPVEDAVQEDGDVLTRMRKRFKLTLSESRKSTPSVRSKPLNYLTFQNGIAPILDGRYGATQNSLALPVELHHSAFAHFAAIARDSEHSPPDDIVNLTIRLMEASSQIVTTELERQSTTRDLFSQIMGFPLVQTVHLNKTSADHSAIYPLSAPGLISSAVIGVFEEKAELGTSGDPSTQGSFSYLQHWTEPGQKALMETSSCPSFIIAVAGPWLVVLGAVFTSCAIVQRLTEFIWLGDSRTVDDTRTFHVARILSALREGGSQLRTFYETYSIPAELNARFFPYATSFIEHNGTSSRTVRFSYKRPLKLLESPSECAAFLATTSDGKPVVVKFVERYGATAHKKLAEIGMAPALLYHGDVWPADEVASKGCFPRTMVVMEYIDGETCEDGVSDAVRMAVRRALEHLHSQKMVHGDIRPPNIIIEGGEGGEENRVKVLDFDWAGKEGEARYPLRLSPGIWPAGVKDNHLITADHDKQMLERL